jgi:hypothetical protein
MAQNWVPKQQNWLTRISQAAMQLMADADALQVLCTEFTNDQYGGGGANALTDATVQGILPASTAALVDEAEGALAGSNAVLAVIATNRGYLETLRP